MGTQTVFIFFPLPLQPLVTLGFPQIHVYVKGKEDTMLNVTQQGEFVIYLVTEIENQ